jgi:hypothetical protein
MYCCYGKFNDHTNYLKKKNLWNYVLAFNKFITALILQHKVYYLYSATSVYTISQVLKGGNTTEP